MVVKMRANILHVDPIKFKAFRRLLYACCRGCENEYISYSEEPDSADKCLSCIDKLESAYRNQVPFTFERKTSKIKSNIEKTK